MKKVKRCSTCGEHKDHTEFWKVKRSKDGLNYQCISCTKEYRQRPEVKAKRRKAAQKYHQSAKGQAAAKRHYENNKQKCIDYANKSLIAKRRAKRAELNEQGDTVGRWLCEQIAARPELQERYSKWLDEHSEPAGGVLATNCQVIRGQKAEYPVKIVSVDGIAQPLRAFWIACAIDGKVPPRGCELDRSHLCHNKKCVNADHLLIESPKDNLARGGVKNGVIVQGYCGGRPKKK